MERAEFIERYMSGSRVTDYTVKGEIVTITGWDWPMYALPCKCGEEGCEGWAMVPHGSQHWHKFQNELTDMTGEEAMQADLDCRP
jgi:hypothetical protein